MMVNERGLRLIAEFEGFSPVPYQDPVGHCTVGYGELLHLGPCTAADMARPPITEEEGLAALADKVVPYAEAVLEQVTIEINENQLDALASLCYNVGPGGIRNVVRAVNTGGDVCAELRKIIHGTNGVVYPGLVRRREAECVLYNTPVEERMYSDKDIDDKIGEAVALGVRNQQNLADLANGQDAVIAHNDVKDGKPKLTLKGLWFIAGKAWPF